MPYKKNRLVNFGTFFQTTKVRAPKEITRKVAQRKDINKLGVGKMVSKRDSVARHNNTAGMHTIPTVRISFPTKWKSRLCQLTIKTAMKKIADSAKTLSTMKRKIIRLQIKASLAKHPYSAGLADL